MRRSLGSNWYLTALVAGTLLALPAGAASAQGTDGNWWEMIPGFGRADSQPRRTSDEDPRKRGERPDLVANYRCGVRAVTCSDIGAFSAPSGGARA